MNILYISQWFSPIGGGGEVVFCNVASGMAKRGNNVHVICAQIADLKRESQDNISIHTVKPELHIPPPSIRENVLFIIRTLLNGYQIIQKNKIELIHANNLSSAIAGSILARISDKPLITTIHDVFSTSSPNHWNHWMKQDAKISRLTSIIAPLVEKITVKMPTDVIQTVSDSSKEDLIKFGAKSPVKVIPNGLDPSSYSDLRFTRDYQNCVLFIGRLVFYKNLNVVISSFERVVKKSPDSKLFIVGDGPMRQKWERMVSDMALTRSIEFTGYISEERKFELLNKCSALLVPSFVEGFGLVILESFAMYKPVLVADVKPCNELVDDGIDGFTLPVDNPDKWSEKISFLFENKDVCRKMGTCARDKLEKKYSLDSALDSLESLYLHIIEKS